MARICVVDDSKVDRALIAGLLESHSDFDVGVVDNAKTALRQFADAPPDLVVTDLIMPEMDGFEFVKEMRLQFPSTPVILMTAYGNETIAVKALEAGAASYVPKARQAESLVETVRRVLARAEADKSGDVVSLCMDELHCKLTLDNDPALIRPVIDELQHRVAAICITDPTERVRTMVALEEALFSETEANGNPGRKIQLEVKLTKVGACFIVRGNGHERPALISNTSDCFQSGEGRGRMLIRSLVDRVVQNEHDDELILLKQAR